MGNNQSLISQERIKPVISAEKAQPSFSVQKIIQLEELFPIQGIELQELLHRSIVAITFLDNKVRYSGSGVLISRNVVLTAAHNIFSRIRGKEYENFKVYVGVDGVAENYYEVEALRYAQQYKNCTEEQSCSFDYALLKLKKIVSYNQFPQVSSGCAVCLMKNNQQTILQIFGFPGRYCQNYKPLDKYHNKFQLTQFGLALKNRIVAIDPSQHKICYGISTMQGQSGCPVVVDGCIIAVHVGGGKIDQQFNIGRLIDVLMASQLENWCQQLKGYPFLIKDDHYCVHLKQNLALQQKHNKIKINNQMKELNLASKDLKNINLSDFGNLVHLYLENNQLHSINLTQNTQLTILFLQNNYLQTIDVRKNQNLQILSLSQNKLSAIDITKNYKLTKVFLQENCLQNISVLFTSPQRLQNYKQWFRFDDQNSKICLIRIHYNQKDVFFNFMEQYWTGKYSLPSRNIHKCKYSILKDAEMI